MGIIVMINILLMTFFFVLAFMSIRYFINQIEKYPRVTLKEVYASKKLRQKYNILNKKDPGDYGYKFEEIAYKSGKIQLYGWWIKSERATKTMMLCHGRKVNRLASLQYLQIFKETGLDKEYNFFIPDFRNSGKSDVAKTKLGYNFAIDINHTMEMLQDKFGQNKFVLFGQSQGGMGSAIASRLHVGNLRKRGIKIEKLILDSSISNVKKRIKEDAKKRKVPKFIASVVIRIFNIRVGNRLDKLRLSYLLKRIPTLIIHSKSDKATTYSMLMGEMKYLKENKLIQLKVFEKGSHTRIYAEENNKDEYTQTIFNFLKEK